MNLKTKKFLTVTLGLLLIGTAFTTYLKDSSGSSPVTEAQIGTISTASSGTKLFLDIPVYNNVQDLLQLSDIVVVGKVVGKGGSRNLARNPANPKDEASDRKIISQEYSFMVEEWVKGDGSNRIDIVYPEYTVIDEQQIQEPIVALEPGHRYVLFLKQGMSNTYYGVGEPWQFQLLNGQAKLRTAVDDKFQELVGLSEEELVSKIKNASK